MKFDYSIHYKRFHDGSEADVNRMKAWLCTYLQADLPPDRSTPILDIGCGFGFALHALRELNYSDARGLETSNEQAQFARTAGFPVDVVEDSADYLRRHPQTFGAILLMDVLEHLPPGGQLEFLEALRNALLPNGRVILTVPNANAQLASRWRYIDFTHHASFTEHSLFFALRSAGFGEIRMDNSKGLGPFPKGWWKREQKHAVRKWLVRWMWLQVFKAEVPPGETLDGVCFELNLKALAFNNHVLPSVDDPGRASHSDPGSGGANGV